MGPQSHSEEYFLNQVKSATQVLKLVSSYKEWFSYNVSPLQERKLRLGGEAIYPRILH